MTRHPGEMSWSIGPGPEAVYAGRVMHQRLRPQRHRLQFRMFSLLLDLQRPELPDAQVAAFDFRAVRPTFDLHPFSVHGKPSSDGKTVELWAQDYEGWLTMQGTATLA